MKFYLALLLFATALIARVDARPARYVRPLLGENLPNLIQQLTDNVHKMANYSTTLKTLLANDLDAGHLTNFTEFVALVEPVMANLPRSAENLNEQESVNSLVQLGVWQYRINLGFTRSMKLLLERANLSDVDYRERLEHWNTDEFYDLWDEYYRNPKYQAELRVLDYILQQWNDMLVKVTIPYQQTLYKVPYSVLTSSNQTWSLEDVRQNVLISLLGTFPTLCTFDDLLAKRDYGSPTLRDNIHAICKDSSHALVGSIAEVADDAWMYRIDNCSGLDCVDFRRIGKKLKDETWCY